MDSSLIECLGIKVNDPQYKFKSFVKYEVTELWKLEGVT